MARNVFYKTVPARMPNGQLRRVRVRATRHNGRIFPDTDCTAPAFVTSAGRAVRGFVECEDTLPLHRDFEPCHELKFTPMDAHAHLLGVRHS